MKHGGDIYSFAKSVGCEVDEVVDFSSNINCYQPKLSIHLEPFEIARYHDSNYSSLKAAIANRYGVDEDMIALFNGASRAIRFLLKQLENKKRYLYEPIYSEYRVEEYESIHRFENIEQEIEDGSVVVFVNPSTPDGRYYAIDSFMQKWMQKGCTIIIDESFLEFEDLLSVRAYLKEYNKLYIIQSFSKFYSCAGVRVGAIFSQKANIARFFIEPWQIATFDAKFLEMRLRDDDFVQKSQAIHKKQKDELYTILHKSQLFEKIFPSSANFFLTYSKKSKEILQKLQKEHILVRICDNFSYLGQNYLRFGIKDSFMHQKLKKALYD